MFIDQAVIEVRSGKGGDGMVHFRREKYVPRGGPDGGDGGKGGDVVLVVEPRLNTLSAFRHQLRYQAEEGKNGAKQKMFGRSGEDLLILVPPGTMVFDADSGALLSDLVTEGQRFVAVKGGRGGRGNVHFATSVHQTPRTAERGAPAEEKRLRLELKLIADVGIVGVPNAGKSTLLAASTNARPKIAPYPFTTVEPNLGVVDLDEDTSLILADIPGLIEGASQGVGLGHDFLRHIQRTRVLIHLLDGMSEDPLLDYAQINSELALFDPLLKQKPQVIALNKLDLDDVKARWPELARKFKARRLEILGISAVTGENVRQLLFKAYELLQTAPQVEPLAEGGGELPVYRPEEDARAFTIEREPGGWRVRGKAIERAAEMTYWELDQSVRRFQALIQRTGIEAGLRKAGVQPGDTVFIGEYELEWAD